MYPTYLKEQRLNENLDVISEKQTKGHGGKRLGAGRPKGSVKEERFRISLPKNLANWFRKNPQAIEITRKTMQKHKSG